MLFLRVNTMDIHLYLMCFRTEAIVASHLPPSQFGNYMAIGSTKRTFGYVAFLEMDPSLRIPELHLRDVEMQCIPHKDGSPRKSKYMSVYRVLEHLPLGAIGDLYLTSRDGKVMGVSGHQAEAGVPDSGKMYMYAELCPATPLVVTGLEPVQFAAYMTTPGNLVSVPKILFADIKIDRDRLGHLADYLPYPDPVHIEDCLNELESADSKQTKTVDRHPPLQGFYNSIATGFYLGDASVTRHYAFPDAETLERDHREWWRSASLG
jgi:hypothetical protein